MVKCSNDVPLVQALEKNGVGNWREISEQYLPKWDDQAIRIKASRLMGSQSLARYVGWKGNRYSMMVHNYLCYPS